MLMYWHREFGLVGYMGLVRWSDYCLMDGAIAPCYDAEDKLLGFRYDSDWHVAARPNECALTAEEWAEVAEGYFYGAV